MYKTVVFDLDGTLLNTLTDLADAGNRLCRKYGWPTHERQAYRYFVGNGIPKLVERLAPADQRTPAVLEAALADFKQDYGQHLRDTTAPYPGIPEMLAKLKANGACSWRCFPTRRMRWQKRLSRIISARSILPSCAAR